MFSGLHQGAITGHAHGQLRTIKRNVLGIAKGNVVAGLREMALGIASALRTGSAPNPLPVELWGQSPEDAARLLKFVVDECVDAGIGLREIRADPVIVHELAGSKNESGVFHRAVPISADPRTRGRMDFFSES